jgi:hypothetical protein
MGRRRKQGNYTTQKNNSIEDLVGNEGNAYPAPDSSENNDKCHQ